MRSLVHYALIAVAAASAVQTARAFTTAPTMKLGLSSSLTKPKFDLLSSVRGAAATDKDNSSTDSIMKEFERKEAKIQKRREEAMARLDKYETTLQDLQSKKAEYQAAGQIAAPPAGGTFSETTMRSAVKAFAWRVVAGTITFMTTLQFSGSMKTALQVVGTDFFSKAATMFIGERLMNKSQKGRKSGGDSTGRSLTKALVWRLFAIANTLTMAVLISKDLSVASKIASTDAVFKTGLMFFYERMWARIDWGKDYLMEFSI